MRVIVSTIIAAMIVFSGGCASIPLSTALSLSSLTPSSLAQIDPAQVRVRVSVPIEFEINLQESHLSLGLTTSSGTRSASMKLSSLGMAKETRSGGLFKADVPVSTYLLALSPDGALQLQELQLIILTEEPAAFEFGVKAPFSRFPENPKEVTFWADLKLSSNESFMPLVKAAKIQFEHSPASN